MWTGCMWIRIGPVAVSCEHGNETSDSIKCGKFLDLLSDSQLPRKDCAPLSQLHNMKHE
jgi:hypothetical protein